MEVEMSKEGDGDFPWMSCVMGCRPPEDEEVTLLKCFHVICSSTCNDNWKKELNLKEGDLPYCRLCRMLVNEDDLKEKLILKKVFPPKPKKDEVKLICESCIHDKPATSYCPTCPYYLCDSCANFHPNLRSSVNHKLERNLEPRREIEFHKILEKHNQCNVESHSGSPITKYCTTCQQKLCAQCDHDSSHKILETQKGKELFIENWEATKELKKKLEESIEKTRCKREEFSPLKYIAVTSKISKDFALMNRTLRKCHKRTMEEVRKTFTRRSTDLAKLESRLEFMKKKIAQMCKTYGSVQENLDEFATYNFSLLAPESREKVNKFSELIENGHLDIIEDSKEFSLDPEFMKWLQGQLEKGPVKFQYEMDFKNLDDETPAVPEAVVDGDTKAEDAGGGAGASSEKDIIVTEIFSLNPSASPPKRRVAVKSTGYGIGRPTPLLTPIMNGKPVQTYPAPSRRSVTAAATSTSPPVPSTSSKSITPIPAASATSTPVSKSQSNDTSSPTSQTTAFQIQMYMTSKRVRTENLNNVSSQPGSSTTVTASEGNISMKNGGGASTEESPKEATSKGEIADKMEVDSTSKMNGVEEPNEAKENGGQETVQLPGISPNETSLSDSSKNVVTLRVGLRTRKNTICQDFVASGKDIVFNTNEDTEDTGDTWSENGFKSGTESDLNARSSRRQTLRKRGDSSASRFSTPALGELASDKKRGKGFRTSKRKRTRKSLTSDDSVSDDGGPDKLAITPSLEPFTMNGKPVPTDPASNREPGTSSPATTPATSTTVSATIQAVNSVRGSLKHGQQRMAQGKLDSRLDKKIFNCDKCSKSFVTKGQLDVHMRCHTGEKPYKCNRCGRSFRQSSNLIAHKRTHTGEKPYRCSICFETFTQKANLDSHVIAHH